MAFLKGLVGKQPENYGTWFKPLLYVLLLAASKLIADLNMVQ